LTKSDFPCDVAKPPLRGLYLITNDDEFSLLIAKLEAACAAGIALLQYRRKHIPLAQQEIEARTILTLCKRYAVPLIINDNIDLAEKLGCGAHLGQGDGSLVEARKRLGARAIIGRTCHASLALAAEAEREGASYLAFGAVYLSGTKPLAGRVSLETLRNAAQQFALPICAIGGLNLENSAAVKAAGVSLFAVVGDILNLPVQDVSARVSAWRKLLDVV
jgi:thiamine-phosphate pyrophosphorylase